MGAAIHVTATSRATKAVATSLGSVGLTEPSFPRAAAVRHGGGRSGVAPASPLRHEELDVAAVRACPHLEPLPALEHFGQQERAALVEVLLAEEDQRRVTAGAAGVVAEFR